MLSADLSPAEREAGNTEAAGFVIDHVSRRYALLAGDGQAPDDLVTALIREESDRQRLIPLTPDEVIRFCLTLVFAGAETTTFLLGNLVAALLAHPDLYGRMHADRALISPSSKRRCVGPLLRNDCSVSRPPTAGWAAQRSRPEIGWRSSSLQPITTRTCSTIPAPSGWTVRTPISS